MTQIEKYAKELATKLNDIKFIDIETRSLTISDISKLNNKQIVRIMHSKGFNIQIRKSYKIEFILNVSTLMYSDDMYIVCDELLGRHPVEFNAGDMVDYVNGLLGY